MPECGSIVDGVVRYPLSGINVVIVGAGLGGLQAAVECWRKGHEVQVLEKGEAISEAGDVIRLGPNSYAILKEYPTMLQEWDQFAFDVETCFCHRDGKFAIPKAEFEHHLPGVATHVIWPIRAKPIASRRDLALMFLGQCKRLGIPVTYGVNITQYSEDGKGTATAHAEDGRTFTGDVVIAADGIGSKSCGVTLGKPVRAVSTGYCADRVMYSTEHIKDAPALQKAIAELERPQLRMYTAPDMYLVFLLSKTHIFLGITHKDDGTAVESWSSTVTPEQTADVMPDKESWDPVLMEAIHSTPPNTVVRWKLCCRNPQPKWHSDGGHIIQVGDAAHSFIPSSGNGASMALEDAMSLPECLRLGGKDRISLAIRVHQLLRYERTSLLQHNGFVNRRQVHRDMNEILKDERQPMLLGKWVWTHHAEKYVTENFENAGLAVEGGKPFKNTNLPVGHQVQPWSIEEEEEKEKSGIFVEDLKNTGDWGLI
ncbi:FAD-dependent monooxygenase fsr3 [Colletotrichum siamense]|uniref:FAD-dependent monooxygenase fsr3 n=1 Tax=Colletotrichum siamense TaxID=690259 RepID=A0A9P5ELR2_COLSI|nr:FAD-dependent monooxygenase fsr3 [Colletotrichum siamense]KAF4853170.1 FAD-dependent monooxygenase fsr3 [Colletotrichum siamense]